MRSLDRSLLAAFALAALVALFALASGCLGGAPRFDERRPRGYGPPAMDPSALASQSTDPGPPPRAGRAGATTTPPGGNPVPPGLVNCYGVAACDPTMQFCIRFYAGSQGAPGSITSGPACYAPQDTCANQGQNMDCGCIQNDAVLGPACQGSCVDHGDGTYDCYQS